MNKIEMIQWLDQQSEELFSISDGSWDHPELGFEEQYSSAVISDALQAHGFEVTRGLDGIPTAFVARFGEGRPYIGILGEFDALPNMNQKAGVCEEQREEAPTQNGHGCGHNLLGAGSLGAAIAVREYLAQTKASGTIFYYGCPAEENGAAKAFMARDGVFSDLDAALSWHPNAFNSVWSFSSLMNVSVYYRFHGVSSHAATSPHLGRSALDALELMNMDVQFLREHIITDARIHYAITNTGGRAPNVVQSEAEALYLIRAPKNTQAREILERVNRIAEGAAMMSDVRVDYEIDQAVSNIVVNNVLERLLFANMKEIGVPQYTEEEYDFARRIQNTIPHRQPLAERLAATRGEEGRKIGEMFDQKGIYSFVMPYSPSEKPIFGSSDVGDVSWVCPTSQIVTATWAGGTTEHSWQAVAQGKSSCAHKGLLYAAKVMAATAVDLIEQPEKVIAAKEEFLRRIGSEGYQPLLPADKKIDIKK